MARDRASSFLRTIEQSSKDMRGVVEAMRIFGYINEVAYSELNTELTILTTEMIRGDGAETIELVRTPIDLETAYIKADERASIKAGHWDDAALDDAEEIPGMIPNEY